MKTLADYRVEARGYYQSFLEGAEGSGLSEIESEMIDMLTLWIAYNDGRDVRFLAGSEGLVWVEDEVMTISVEQADIHEIFTALGARAKIYVGSASGGPVG